MGCHWEIAREIAREIAPPKSSERRGVSTRSALSSPEIRGDDGEMMGILWVEREERLELA